MTKFWKTRRFGFNFFFFKLQSFKSLTNIVKDKQKSTEKSRFISEITSVLHLVNRRVLIQFLLYTTKQRIEVKLISSSLVIGNRTMVPRFSISNDVNNLNAK